MSQHWFTSDEHHGHRNALTGWLDRATGVSTQPPRPWSTLEDMTEGIIDRHNSVVKRGDNIFHLGDMFWRTLDVDKAIEIMGRLNGQHFYILGNHEELMEEAGRSQTIRQQFVWVRDYAKIKPFKGLSVVLSHYAHRVWDGSHKGTYHAYGHSHGAIPNFGRSMDVGVDCNDFYPVSLDQLVTKLKDVEPEHVLTTRT